MGIGAGPETKLGRTWFLLRGRVDRADLHWLGARFMRSVRLSSRCFSPSHIGTPHIVQPCGIALLKAPFAVLLYQQQRLI